MSEPVKCPECGAYSHDGKEAHGLTAEHKLCSLMSREYLERQAGYYYEQWLDGQAYERGLHKRLSAQVAFWQGKCAMLRHENNKLRRKLFRKEKAQNES